MAHHYFRHLDPNLPHPPEDHVWLFGSLTDTSEKTVVDSFLSLNAKKHRDKDVNIYS